MLRKLIRWELFPVLLLITVNMLVGIWFLLPLVWSMLPFSSAYDNFRQLFFIIPPLFLVFGIVFEWLDEKLSRPFWRVVIPLLLIIPGILSGVQLHPNEYMYYNRILGGTNAAFRQ